MSNRKKRPLDTNWTNVYVVNDWNVYEYKDFRWVVNSQKEELYLWDKSLHRPRSKTFRSFKTCSDFERFGTTNIARIVLQWTCKTFEVNFRFTFSFSQVKKKGRCVIKVILTILAIFVSKAFFRHLLQHSLWCLTTCNMITFCSTTMARKAMAWCCMFSTLHIVSWCRSFFSIYWWVLCDCSSSFLFHFLPCSGLSIFSTLCASFLAD